MKLDRRLVVYIIGGVFIALVIGLIIYALIPRGDLVLALAPEEGTLTINGKSQSVKNGQSVSLSPGKYSVVFSRDEFDSSVSKEVTIDNQGKTDFVAVLNPLTDAARQLLLTPDARKVIERNSGALNAAASDKLTETNPILSILPIKARLYTISSCLSQKYPGDLTKVALCANLSQPGLEPYVLKDIQSRGFDPSTLEIIYVDKYSDPDEI